MKNIVYETVAIIGGLVLLAMSFFCYKYFENLQGIAKMTRRITDPQQAIRLSQTPIASVLYTVALESAAFAFVVEAGWVFIATVAVFAVLSCWMPIGPMPANKLLLQVPIGGILISLMISVFGVLTWALAMRVPMKGFSYHGPARVVAYNATVVPGDWWLPSSQSKPDMCFPNERAASVTVAWGGKWGCPNHKNKQCNSTLALLWTCPTILACDGSCDGYDALNECSFYSYNGYKGRRRRRELGEEGDNDDIVDDDDDYFYVDNTDAYVEDDDVPETDDEVASDDVVPANAYQNNNNDKNNRIQFGYTEQDLQDCAYNLYAKGLSLSSLGYSFNPDVQPQYDADGWSYEMIYGDCTSCKVVKEEIYDWQNQNSKQGRSNRAGDFLNNSWKGIAGAILCFGCTGLAYLMKDVKLDVLSKRHASIIAELEHGLNQQDNSGRRRQDDTSTDSSRLQFNIGRKRSLNSKGRDDRKVVLLPKVGIPNVR